MRHESRLQGRSLSVERVFVRAGHDVRGRAVVELEGLRGGCGDDCWADLLYDRVERHLGASD